MARRRTNKAALALKSAELMNAVPQVVGHRLARMALARFPLEERDRREFTRMVTEKTANVADIWQAMALGALQANQAFALQAARFWFAAPYAARHSPWQVFEAQWRLLEQMLVPTHRKVKANARRLAKTRLR